MRTAIPMYDRVLVKRISEEETSRGGIIIPDVAKEKPVEGIIINKGVGRMSDTGTLLPMMVEIGDHILFGKYSGQDIKVGIDDYVILREEEILARLQETT